MNCLKDCKKTIVPFATSGSSGMGEINSKVLNGNPSKEELGAWVKSLNL